MLLDYEEWPPCFCDEGAYPSFTFLISKGRRLGVYPPTTYRRSLPEGTLEYGEWGVFVCIGTYVYRSLNAIPFVLLLPACALLEQSV